VSSIGSPARGLCRYSDCPAAPAAPGPLTRVAQANARAQLADFIHGFVRDGRRPRRPGALTVRTSRWPRLLSARGVSASALFSRMVCGTSSPCPSILASRREHDQVRIRCARTLFSLRAGFDTGLCLEAALQQPSCCRAKTRISPSSSITRRASLSLFVGVRGMQKHPARGSLFDATLKWSIASCKGAAGSLSPIGFTVPCGWVRDHRSSVHCFINHFVLMSVVEAVPRKA